MYGHREMLTAGYGDYNTIRVTSEGTFRYPESCYHSNIRPLRISL